ncbi:DUF1345 domain-containing protein [Brevundimonas sp.]|uniref:DUF1345 domain-containing protein n=1 Tax=Brevundimonas sp. TaxID=1871086 RepID=UPI003BABB36D
MAYPCMMPSPARLIRLHWTLLVALAVVVAVGLLTPADWRWATRAAVGWDAGVALFLLITIARLTRARSTDQIRQRAAELDDAGSAVLPLSLLAAAASVAIVISEAISAPASAAAGSAALVMLTLVLSWSFIHLMFSQHYAHEFYAPSNKGDGDQGGLIFPGEDDPDYWDFLHFSLIIGVASQTADIQMSSRRLRRIGSIHSVTAFVFNTVIVALGVNFAISLIGN